MVKKHKEIIDACLQNDRRAQMKIYDLYYKAMYNTSLRIVGDSFLAEDVMQEAFLTAFRSLDQFEWRSSFGSWLRRIVVNKSTDALRAKHDLSRLNEEITDYSDDSSDDDTEVNKCKVEEIKHCMSNLSADYRILLVLFLIEGYDHQEMAEILNMKYNNVRVKYFRAKRKLIEEIVKSGKVA